MSSIRVALIAFCVLAATLLVRYQVKPQDAIELVSLMFFACWGCFAWCAEYARVRLGKQTYSEFAVVLFMIAPLAMVGALTPLLLMHYFVISFFMGLAALLALTRWTRAATGLFPAKDRTFGTYSPFRNAIPLLVVGYGAAILVVVGGGLLRRGLESLLFELLTLLDFRAAVPYRPLPSIFDKPDDWAWQAITVGWLLGLVIGAWWTLRPQDVVAAEYLDGSTAMSFRPSSHFSPREAQLEKAIAPLDGFGLGFFTIYGMDAALRAINALPLKVVGGVLVERYWPLFIFTILTVPTFAALTAAGGSLLRDAVVKVGLLGTLKARELLLWFRKPDMNFAAFSSVVFVLIYLVLDWQRNHGGLASLFFPTREDLLFAVMIVSALTTMFIWTYFSDRNLMDSPPGS